MLGLSPGCGDDGGSSTDTTGTLPGTSSGSSTGDAGIPVVTTSADVAAVCGLAGVTRVELQATRVGCVSPPPAPCTLPNPLRTTIGDAVTCPADASPVTLSVDITMAGRHAIELVGWEGEMERVRMCHSIDAERELLVDNEAFDAGEMFSVTLLDTDPCQ